MDDVLGPLAILYCWQSCVLAFLVTTGTHGVKLLIDYNLGGKEERKKQMFFNSLVLPATPILLGGLLGAFIPLWPEALTEYLKVHSVVGWHSKLAMAAYGAAVGQFADYAWQRYSSIVNGVKAKNDAAALVAPAVAPPADPAVPPAPPTIPPVA